jgi:hypothetical protein
MPLKGIQIRIAHSPHGNALEQTKHIAHYEIKEGLTITTENTKSGIADLINMTPETLI